MLRDRCRTVAVTDNSGDADGRVNRKPTLRGNVNRHKQVTGKQGRPNLFNAPCVPALLEIARQIDDEALATQMRGRLGLGVRVSLRDIPARSKINAHARL